VGPGRASESLTTIVVGRTPVSADASNAEELDVERRGIDER
jgi:hypothetical protein